MTSNQKEKKIRFLVCGPVLGNLDQLQKKLKTLQDSKAGPFDMCLCVGPLLDNSGEEAGEGDLKAEEALKEMEFAIPVYALEVPNNVSKSVIVENKEKGATATISSSSVVPIGKNIFHLRGGGDNNNNDYCCADIATLPLDCKDNDGLRIAWMPSSARIGEETTSSLEKVVGKDDYKGCDLLLTSEWGQGFANSNVLQSDYQKVIVDEHSNDIQEIGCYDVARIAALTKPRYHFAPGLSNCAYRHMASLPFLTAPESPPCRFIALSKFSKLKDSKFKFLHAISLSPLSNTELSTTDHTQLLSPYASLMNTVKSPPSSSLPSDPNACLFLHGLAKDKSNAITGVHLLQSFQPYGCSKIHIPPNGHPSFAFLFFHSHSLANDCLNILQGQITVLGITLSLKWRTVNSRTATHGQDQQQQLSKRRKIITEAEASHSTQLYIRLLKNNNGHYGEQPQQPSLTESFEEIRKLLQTTLEKAINDGQESEDNKITADVEPALVVTLRQTANPTVDSFAFCNFASHAAASMAIAALTHSMDGGDIDPTKIPPDHPHLTGTMLFWANASGAAINNNSNFTKPTIDSCWFCLSNPNIIQHLIIYKHEHSYITIPRGPVTTYHSLIVPKEHHAKGMFTLPHNIILSILDIKRKLQHHTTNTNKESLFVYERAFGTRGGLNHSHFQCIPIPNDLLKAGDLEATVQAKASQLGFEFEQVTDDDLIQRDLSSYFYIDLPIFTKDVEPTYKQLIYVPKGSNEEKDNDTTTTQNNQYQNIITPPLQFGRDIIASLLGKPELSHWKSCVMGEDKEKQIADEFRKSLLSIFDSEMKDDKKEIDDKKIND